MGSPVLTWLLHLWTACSTYIPAFALIISALALLVSSLSVLATIAGWRLSYLAQTKLLLLKAKTDAREAIVRELRAQEDHLSMLKSHFTRVVHTSEFWTDGIWEAEYEKFSQLVYSDPWWLQGLEEYELLFPETRRVRLQLMARDLTLGPDLYAHQFTSMRGAFSVRDQLLREAPELLERLENKGAFLHDLLVHVQNSTFSGLTKRKVPTRQILDPRLPRIEMQNGELILIEPNRTDTGPTEQ